MVSTLQDLDKWRFLHSPHHANKSLSSAHLNVLHLESRAAAQVVKSQQLFVLLCVQVDFFFFFTSISLSAAKNGCA